MHGVQALHSLHPHPAHPLPGLVLLPVCSPWLGGGQAVHAAGVAGHTTRGHGVSGGHGPHCHKVSKTLTRCVEVMSSIPQATGPEHQWYGADWLLPDGGRVRGHPGGPHHGG